MKNRPAKAFVLAAGFGTRLLPLTRAVSKPLLPLWGTAMIDRALDMVQAWGVTDVVVNVHHGADALVRHLVQKKKDGLRVEISFEPEILGTGGALTKASWFFSDGKPFWVVNADVAADVNPAPLRRAFKPGGTLAAAWVMASRGPRTVECRRGFITNFQSPTPGADHTCTFCGVHLVDPKVLDYLPVSGFASVIKAYQDAMKDGWKIAGVPIENAFWADVGTPAQYLEAHRAMAKRPRRGFVSISAGSTVERGASLHDCVVLSGSRVVRGAKATGMIIGPNVTVRKCSGVMAMRAVDALDEHELALVRTWMPKLGTAIACPLSPRGSARTFTRIYAGQKSVVLVRHDPKRVENESYAGHARFLKSLALPVPAVFVENRERHIALYEDVGEQSVQDLAPTWSAKKLESLYADVLDAMVIFHETGVRQAARRNVKLMPRFDEKLYGWEHDLFTGLFLRDRVKIDNRRLAAIERELKTVSRRLKSAAPVLVHRDLQSSNIMVKGRAWSLIDFQGMRLGPAVYDLASLLCDPYLLIASGMRDRLLAHYAARADSSSRCAELFWHGAVQRLGQALGAYARLGALPGTGHFVKYIRPALANIDEALERIDGMPVLRATIRECREKAPS